MALFIIILENWTLGFLLTITGCIWSNFLINYLHFIVRCIGYMQWQVYIYKWGASYCQTCQCYSKACYCIFLTSRSSRTGGFLYFVLGSVASMSPFTYKRRKDEALWHVQYCKTGLFQYRLDTTPKQYLLALPLFPLSLCLFLLSSCSLVDDVTLSHLLGQSSDHDIVEVLIYCYIVVLQGFV